MFCFYEGPPHRGQFSYTHTQGGGTWRGLGLRQPRNEKEEKPMLVSRRQPRQQVEAAEEEAGGTKRFVKS